MKSRMNANKYPVGFFQSNGNLSEQIKLEEGKKTPIKSIFNLTKVVDKVLVYTHQYGKGNRKASLPKSMKK